MKRAIIVTAVAAAVAAGLWLGFGRSSAERSQRELQQQLLGGYDYGSGHSGPASGWLILAAGGVVLAGAAVYRPQKRVTLWKVLKYVLGGLALLAVTDAVLWARGYVPLVNRTYGLLSGAPAVHLNGRLLSYHGRFPTSPGYLKPWQASDEGYPLFMVVNPYGTIPPWIYIPRMEAEAFRYKYPRR